MAGVKPPVAGEATRTLGPVDHVGGGGGRRDGAPPPVLRSWGGEVVDWRGGGCRSVPGGPPPTLRLGSQSEPGWQRRSLGTGAGWRGSGRPPT